MSSHVGRTGSNEETMVELYDEMILIHQVVAPLIGIQKKAQEVVKPLKVEKIFVDHLQEWAIKYPNAP